MATSRILSTVGKQIAKKSIRAMTQKELRKFIFKQEGNFEEFYKTLQGEEKKLVRTATKRILRDIQRAQDLVGKEKKAEMEESMKEVREFQVKAREFNRKGGGSREEADKLEEEQRIVIGRYDNLKKEYNALLKQESERVKSEILQSENVQGEAVAPRAERTQKQEAPKQFTKADEKAVAQEAAKKTIDAIPDEKILDIPNVLESRGDALADAKKELSNLKVNYRKIEDLIAGEDGRGGMRGDVRKWEAEYRKRSDKLFKGKSKAQRRRMLNDPEVIKLRKMRQSIDQRKVVVEDMVRQLRASQQEIRNAIPEAEAKVKEAETAYQGVEQRYPGQVSETRREVEPMPAKQTMHVALPTEADKLEMSQKQQHGLVPGDQPRHDWEDFVEGDTVEPITSEDQELAEIYLEDILEGGDKSMKGLQEIEELSRETSGPQ